jgi:hypothetical protein
MPNTDVGSLGDGALLRTTQASFDVRIEADVIALLRMVHVNTIDPDLKNHLRDLIFAYRQSTTTANLQLVQDAFLELGIHIVGEEQMPLKTVEPAASLQKKPSYISTSRPQPRFATVEPSSSIVAEAIGVPSYIEDVVAIDKEVVTEPQAIVVPEPTPIIVETKSNAEEKIVEPALVIATPLTYVSTYANPADRIKQIKHEVNEKVGNPINLIDANNEVGREYMNALLDAMKKSNGGQAQEVNEAMMRLEKAFSAVLNVISNGPGVAGLTQTTTEQEKRMQPVVPTMREEVPVATPVGVRSSADALSNPVKIKIVQEQVPVTPEVLVESEREKEISKPVQTEPASVPSHFTSVAQDKSLQDSAQLQHEDILMQQQKEQAAKTSQMDPLQTPAVTAGLGQLLSEWNLFKSSGIFGTGPSGKDHVLYLKLAPLTMAAVIAGRFEGVTPKIKQSIADYMNGWRYEEGIAHEHGETFEHYLRRVIHHILNKNTK